MVLGEVDVEENVGLGGGEGEVRDYILLGLFTTKAKKY